MSILDKRIPRISLGRLAALAALSSLVACDNNAQKDAVEFAASPAVPGDAAATCTVSDAEFAEWKSVSGFNAPNSATFDDATACNFYKWSSQMFLWLTSSDGDGQYNLFSPTIYNIVNGVPVQNSDGDNKFTGQELSFKARTTKIDGTGQAGGGGVVVLNGQEQSSAGGEVYPIVYYAVQVNDVYAGLENNQGKVGYFNSGDTAGQFPTSLEQAKEIQTAAGATYSDLEQLAIELKSSWVDVTYLSDAQKSGLIQIEAEVPTYTQSTNADGNLVLTPSGLANRTLALTGIHMVGSVKGHPELVWASMETTFNAPDADYSYLNSNYDVATKACPSGKNCISSVSFDDQKDEEYIFWRGDAASTLPFPVTETATDKKVTVGTKTVDTIVSTSPSLLPTNIARLNPWGGYQPKSPSLTDAVVLNNTLLISLNNSVMSKLPVTDTQSNYYLIGAIWTQNGTVPNNTGYVLKGSLNLSNSTMETFQQYLGPNGDPNDPGKFVAASCFTCHSIGPGQADVQVSHIFNYKPQKK